MSDLFPDTLRELLAESLTAWQLAGDVRSIDSSTVRLACRGTEIQVEAAPPGSPFRWIVNVNGRKRAALSVPAVLRRVRIALDPEYERYQVRIAPGPVVPL